MTTTQLGIATSTDELRRSFGHFPSGVAALAARVGGIDTVFVVSTFTVGVSLEPPLVMFAVQRSSTTWPLLRDVESIGVSVLSAGQELLCRQLAMKDKAARWKGSTVAYSDAGAVFVAGACLTLECSIYAEYPAGDHDIVILEVLGSTADMNLEPLVFQGSRLRTLD